MIYSDGKDMGDLKEYARSYVKEKIFPEAIFALASLDALTKVTDLRENGETQTSESLLSKIITKKYVNEKGKTVESQEENAEKTNMNQVALQCHKLLAENFIEPARKQIKLEHYFTINDVLQIVSHSTFVPPERQCLFAKGLHAGLMGDFFISTHILIPQIENSIRHLLQEE
ncbi:MAG: DUF4209 domain-containing protein, partial [Okeania sp. SIO2D1]|nr:DUF4209 domain-containing protein [Okeania sp. SIO2D1]